MGTRALAGALVALATGVLVCEVQQLHSLAAIDIENAERCPTLVRGIATDAMEAAPGDSTDATVVVMVWVNGECRVYRESLDWGVPEEMFFEGDPSFTPDWMSADAALAPCADVGP